MKSFQIITPEEVEAIHATTLRILSEVGIVLTHPEGREILIGAGATIDGDRVLLPPDLVEAQVALTPDTVPLRGRESAITLGDGSLHWHNLGGARDVFEVDSGLRRPATLDDVRSSTRLLDALEHVTSITPLYTPQDVPGHLMSLSMYRHALPHTTKPLQGPGVASTEQVRFAASMASVIGPPSEVLSLSVSPVSPLNFPTHVVESIIEVARHGITFGPLPCPTAGATAPMSLAGAIAQQNAEVLATIVLAQLVHPGLPIIYCGRLAMMEPRTGSSVWGGIELGLASAGTVAIGHRYRLPVNVYGFATNAFAIDAQNGYERALNAFIPALAGADELSGIGELDAGVMSAPAQIVMDNEFAGGIRRAVRGFAVDEDTLAVEVVAEALRTTHNFLSMKHTVQHLRGGEIYRTKLAERGTSSDADQTGREDMLDRAQAEADRLLREHEVPPLTDDQERELDAIMEEADRTLQN